MRDVLLTLSAHEVTHSRVTEQEQHPRGQGLGQEDKGEEGADWAGDKRHKWPQHQQGCPAAPFPLP